MGLEMKNWGFQIRLKNGWTVKKSCIIIPLHKTPSWMLYIPGKHIIKSTNHLIHQSIQPTNRRFDQSINRRIEDLINWRIQDLINRSIDKSTNQRIDDLINRQIDELIIWSIDQSMKLRINNLINRWINESYQWCNIIIISGRYV